MAKKKQDRREIFSDLKKGELAPIYYLHGEDGFMLETAVTAVVDAALPQGANDFNFQKFRGNDAAADAIRSAAETLPFMTPRRVVLVQDIQRMPAGDLDSLREYFDDPSPTTVLILVAQTSDKKLDGRTAAVKAMKKAAQEYEFKELRDYEVAPIVERNAKANFNLALDRAAVGYLVEAIGTDLASLMSALQKIDIYLGPETRRATLEHVQTIVSDTRVKSVFDLTDAVGSRNLGDAFKILNRMLVAGESAIGITAMFARHFRIAGKLHDPNVSRLDKNKKAQAIGVSSFFLKDYEADARRFSRKEVEAIRRRLVETDFALKSSRLSDRVIMEALLLDICTRDKAVA